MERIDPIVRWPGGSPRIEPAARADRVHPRDQHDGEGDRRERRESPEEEERDGGDGEHVDVSA